MLITLEEAKGYLRVDSGDEDGFIEQLISSSEKFVEDVMRTEEAVLVTDQPDRVRFAVLYVLAYLYENREDADYKAMSLAVSSLLKANGMREVVF